MGDDMEKDMGPFADMDDDLIAAVTKCGAPPFREIVSVEVADIWGHDFDELPTTPNEFIQWIEGQKLLAPDEYRDRLRFNLEFKSGYDGGGSANLRIWYDCPETDEEMRERVGYGIKCVQDNEAGDRVEYERLKQKFGPVNGGG